MQFAPKAYRETRKKTIKSVEQGLTLTGDLTTIVTEVIKAHPGILPMLRMSTCPPLARDRLIGLADSSKNVVDTLESAAERSKWGQFATPPAIALPFRQVSIDNIFFRDTLISESTG